MEKKFDYLKEKFVLSGFEYDNDIIEKFIRFYDLLIEKNKVMNLTAITEFNDVVIKHFIDSLLIEKTINFKKIENLIDIGTGAGFPGLPLKFVHPEIRMVLMDSLNKRVKFLREVVDELKLENIEVIHSRAEDLAQNKSYREKFDLSVSRAVANLSVLTEYCLPFVKVNGSFVSYKSDNIEKEVDSGQSAVKILGGKLRKVKYIDLDENIRRSFVVIDKVKSTPKEYPRKAGMPSSAPL